MSYFLGVDGGFDPEMKKLANWLIRGAGPSEPITDSKLDDCIFVISQDTFFVYCNKESNNEISHLCSKVPNLIYYSLKGKDVENQDKQEMIKVGQFYKAIFDKQIIGIPLGEPDINSEFYYDRKSEHYMKKVVESWALIQAYALEYVGATFFTIKHKLVNIKEKLLEVYNTQDSYTMAKLLNVNVAQVEASWEQCFGLFSKLQLNKRLSISESDFAAELYIPYELGFMSFENTDLANFDRKDGLSHPRILFGKNTNLPKNARSGTGVPLEQINGKKNDSPFHFICEGVEYQTSMRYARTYFLTNLTQNYAESIDFTHKTDPIPGLQPEKTQMDQNLLFTIYTELSLIFPDILSQINDTKIKHISEIQDFVYANIATKIKSQNIDPIPILEKSNIDISLIGYNCTGQMLNDFKDTLIKVKDWSLYVLRISILHIKSQDTEDLGGICYADSFVFIDENTILNITQNIPQVIGWFTSHKHYKKLDYNPEHVYLLEFPQFGKKIAKYENISGTIPLVRNIGKQNEILVRGTLSLHENGLIFQDQRFHNIFALYNELTAMKFIAKDIICLECEFKLASKLPLPDYNSRKLTLIMPMEFVNENCYQYFETLNDLKHPVSKTYEFSAEYKNYPLFNKLLKEQKSQSPKLFETFIPFSNNTPLDKISKHVALRQIGFLTNAGSLSYTEFCKNDAVKPEIMGKTLDISKDPEMKGKIGIFIISGIPGCGKTDLAASIHRFSNTPKNPWNIINIKAGINCENIEKLKSEIIEISKSHPEVRNLIIVLRGYHILKPYVEFIKQDKDLVNLSVLRGCITKISATNFYQNKYNELYPCIAENCLKGICNLIILERSLASENKVDKITRILSQLNDLSNIITMRGSKLTQTAYDDLVQILLSKPALSALYSKYAYTYSKYYKTKYYLQQIMQPMEFSCAIPIQEKLLRNALTKILGEPITNWENSINSFEYKKSEPNTGDKKLYIDSEEEKMIIRIFSHKFHSI